MNVQNHKTQSRNVTLRRFMNQFSDDFELDEKLSGYENTALYTKKFEIFTAFLALHSFSPLVLRKVDDPISLTIGGSDDMGLDSVIIVINNEYIVDNSEQLQEVIEGIFDNQRSINSVDFIFTQAKTTESFEVSGIHKMISGFRHFMLGDELYSSNEDLQDRFQAKKCLDDKVENIEKINVYIYYMSQAKSNIDSGEIKKFESEILRTREDVMGEYGYTCGEFRFIPCSAFDVIEMYKKYSQFQQKARFSVNGALPLPAVEGIAKSFMTYTSLDEFLNIIFTSEKKFNVEDRNSKLNETIFEENVRSFQGEKNEVNSKILDTLKNGDAQKFFILNNGITMVAEKVIPDNTYTEFTVHDPQIINGCQTSNMLYRYYQYLRDEYDSKEALISKLKEVSVPLKIIEVSNSELTSRIVESTNNQTSINSEQLYALTSVAREVQDFFNEIRGDNDRQDMYYERRSNEYAYDKSVIKSRVIKHDKMLTIYSATYLHLPHKSSRYVKVLKTAENLEHVFNEENHPINFFSAAYAYLRYEAESAKNQMFDKNLRWHTLMTYNIIYGREYSRIDCNSRRFNQDEEIKKIKENLSLENLLIANNVVLNFIQENPVYSGMSIRTLNKKEDFTKALKGYADSLRKKWNKEIEDKFLNYSCSFSSLNENASPGYISYEVNELSDLLKQKWGESASGLFDRVFDYAVKQENIHFGWTNSAVEKNLYKFTIYVSDKSKANSAPTKVGEIKYRLRSKDFRIDLGLQHKQLEDNPNFYDEFMTRGVEGFTCDLSEQKIGTNKHEHALVIFSHNSSDDLSQLISDIISKTYMVKNNVI